MALKSAYADDRSLLNTSEDDVNSATNYGATSADVSGQATTQRSEQLPNGDGQTRSVTKKGIRNITHTNIHYLNKAFWTDIFTTFLDAKWRWLLLVIVISYISSWLIFAVIWYIILYVHGDFVEENLENPTWRPCITNILDFTSTFLFSLETQQTTGYGFYHITEKCVPAVITLCAQSILGVILEGLVVGLVLLKMSRAKKRTATLLFSRHGVVSHRDGRLCFMFRVADLRSKSTLLQATIRAQLITSRVTPEGEEVPLSQEEIEVGGDGERGNTLLLLWPTTVIHRIDDTSPLKRFLTEDGDLDVTSAPFEIIVILEGVVESTGLVTQARSSYLSSEILFGHRFKSLTRTRPSTKSGPDGETFIDYANFDETYPVPNQNNETGNRNWAY